MSEEDESQKTEEPTPKKMEDSRKKGQVAMSREVNTWLILLMATIVMGALGPSIAIDLKNSLQVYLEQAHALPGVPGGFYLMLGQAFQDMLRVLTLPFLCLVFIAFVGPFVQVGPLFSAETIVPKLDKISPVKGLKRLFSMKSLVEFLKGLLKLSTVGVVGFVIISPYFDNFEHLVGMPLNIVLDEVLVLILKMMIGILVVLVIVAVIDLSFQRADHTKKMRMSKQEIKDEYKQTEGDPHMKGKLKQLRAEKGRQRMIQAVPGADVVITNPTHYSIALKYDPDNMEAPMCVAKGMDEIALIIREVAKEHDVTIFENKPLARAMYDIIEVDQMVPTEHFQAVAEVISFVFKQQGKI
jgi:flagellar biosynthetic protein FlhB